MQAWISLHHTSVVEYKFNLIWRSFFGGNTACFFFFPLYLGPGNLLRIKKVPWFEKDSYNQRKMPNRTVVPLCLYFQVNLWRKFSKVSLYQRILTFGIESTKLKMVKSTLLLCNADHSRAVLKLPSSLVNLYQACSSMTVIVHFPHSSR